jgi:protein-L-isoaspartate(D-aspartate) O-methyltransferase
MMDDLSSARHGMVESQIHARGLRDPRLLAAFEQVPRHLFVPAPVRQAAYDDTPLPIGYEQSISQPYIVALMASLLEMEGDERVLEIGTGSGYEAAILSRLAVEVHTIELLPELGQAAARLLHELGYTNVHVHIADGSLGWLPDAPYQAIIAAAAAPVVPKPLLEQLSEGGRLVLPVAEGQAQLLKVFTRRGDGYLPRVVTSVAFVPMRGMHGWE